MNVFEKVYKKSGIFTYFLILVGLSIFTIFYYGFIHNNLLLPEKSHLLNNFSNSVDHKENIVRKSSIHGSSPLTIVEGKHLEYFSKISGGLGSVFLLDYGIKVKNLLGVNKKKWYGFRFSLYPEENGRLIRSVPHVFLQIQKNGRFRDTARLVFDKKYSNYFFAIEIFADNGQVIIGSINLTQYVKGANQLLFEYCLVVIWIITFLWGLMIFKKNNRRNLWANISCILFIIILVGVMVPNSSFHVINGITGNLAYKDVSTKKHTDTFDKYIPLKKKLLSITKELNLHSVGIIKKGGHIVLFGLLTWSLFHALSLLKPFMIVSSVSFLAVISEISQLNIVSRTASLGDVGIDLIGVFLAYTLWVLIRVGGEEASD